VGHPVDAQVLTSHNLLAIPVLRLQTVISRHSVFSTTRATHNSLTPRQILQAYTATYVFVNNKILICKI